MYGQGHIGKVGMPGPAGASGFRGFQIVRGFLIHSFMITKKKMSINYTVRTNLVRLFVSQ